ncbi:MAG TPA: ABC transporter ATP-binding protein [Polyangiaceae bacterium]
MAFVEMNHVSKSYGAAGKRTQVLSDVSLEIQRGEFLAVVGFSGAGKTTLISLIAGLIAADSGSVRVNDKPVTGPGMERGIVFQNYSLLPWLSAFDNVHIAVVQAFPKAKPAENEARAQRYLELVGLGAARAKRPHELSGGMRQRVSVARALAMDPEVLLLDEPLGALDALTRATLQGEIARIWQADRKTVLLITNDVDEAILLADRIVPLGAAPAATLGPSFEVGLERPRAKSELARDPRFKALRHEIVSWLLSSAAEKHKHKHKPAAEAA